MNSYQMLYALRQKLFDWAKDYEIKASEDAKAVIAVMEVIIRLPEFRPHHLNPTQSTSD